MRGDGFVSGYVALLVIATIAIPLASAAGSQRTPSSAQLAKLEAEAHAACLCEQRASNAVNRQACGAALGRNVERWGGSEAVSNCVPVQTTLVCFDDNMEKCILKRHNALGVTLCDGDSAAAVDRAFANTNSRTGDFYAAQAEAGRIARAFARGEHPKVPKSAEGCFG